MRITTTLCASALALCFVSTASARKVNPLYAMGTNNSYFAADMYLQLNSGDENVLFSPYSVSSAMGMVYAGSKNNTAKEISDAFHFNNPGNDFHATFGDLNSTLIKLGNREGGKLNIANALCITGKAPNKAYQDLIAKHYDAEIFSGDVDTINSWVEEKTHGKIDEILEKLNPDSLCVLLNAIYFKSDWSSQFKLENTVDRDFILASGNRVKVPMMHQEGSFRLYEGDTFSALELPYTSGLTMQIYLPNEADGLSDLEKTIKTDSLPGWMAQTHAANAVRVNVALPKFKFETSYSLSNPCKELGIIEAFQGADFSGMGYRQGEVYISQIKHKAVIEVNEEGSEAAAATAVEISRKSAIITPSKTFKADHPFLFTICDPATNTVLFMGRVSNPDSE